MDANRVRQLITPKSCWAYILIPKTEFVLWIWLNRGVIARVVRNEVTPATKFLTESAVVLYSSGTVSNNIGSIPTTMPALPKVQIILYSMSITNPFDGVAKVIRR